MEVYKATLLNMAALSAGNATVQFLANTLAAGIGAKGEFDCPPYNPGGGHAFTDDIAAGRFTAAQCNAGTPAAKSTSLESGMEQAFHGVGNGSEFAGTVPLSLQATVTALKAGLDGLTAAVGTKQQFDCIPYNSNGLPDAYGAACNEGTPGAK